MKAFQILTKWILSLVLICNIAYVNAQDITKTGEIETVVDRLPKLKNSGGNFIKYISKNIEYPENAKLRGIEGDVWVAFVVAKNGEVSDVKVEKSVDPSLDQAVIDFVKKSGTWKPGQKDGQDVNTQMIVPVKFTLSENERNLADQLKTFNLMDGRPLFVLDNKIVDEVVQIEEYNVKSIRVIKGQKAVELYGEQGRNGVVVMTSKRGTPPVY